MMANLGDPNLIGGVLLCLGGLGLFLLGMVVLTDGLRALAGRALRRMLSRFTRSPRSGAMIGALTTAVVQSSSATTVATVGFVGAGLLTFPQALGIVLGANVGTTVTGWLVALLGFKLELGTAALPIVFVGVLIRLFAGGRASSAGFAVAGFGLIFVGISLLQQGMGGFVGIITPESFPGDTWTGRLLLVVFGIVFTLVTQSSSAGVAMALAAVNASAMTVQQAAAAVIGMDIGTTVTAVLATVGGSVHARRTGYAHAMYNIFAGTAAFLILVPFMRAFEHFAPRLLASEPELVLVGFHTFFNLLGERRSRLALLNDGIGILFSRMTFVFGSTGITRRSFFLVRFMLNLFGLFFPMITTSFQVTHGDLQCSDLPMILRRSCFPSITTPLEKSG